MYLLTHFITYFIDNKIISKPKEVYATNFI